MDGRAKVLILLTVAFAAAMLLLGGTFALADDFVPIAQAGGEDSVAAVNATARIWGEALEWHTDSAPYHHITYLRVSISDQEGFPAHVGIAKVFTYYLVDYAPSCIDGTIDEDIEPGDLIEAYGEIRDSGQEISLYVCGRDSYYLKKQDSPSTPTNTPRPTATHTPRPSTTATHTPRPSATPTFTPRPSTTPTNTPRPTSTPTNTPRPTATPRPPELEIMHIEITQAVQDESNDVVLLADKDAIVRVYVRCTANCAPARDVTGSLRVSGEGISAQDPLSPLHKVSTDEIANVANWTELRGGSYQTLNFVVPGSKLQGLRSFYAQVGNATATESASFAEGPSLLVHIVPIKYDGGAAPSDWNAVIEALSVTRALFPASKIQFELHETPFEWNKSWVFIDNLIKDLGSYAHGSNELVYGWLDNSVDIEIPFLEISGYAEEPDGGTAAVGHLGRDWQPYIVMNHELGHLVGLRHANTLQNKNYVECGSENSGTDGASSWYRTYNTPELDEFGAAPLNSRTYYSPEEPDFEFMSYCGANQGYEFTTWVSKLYYEQANDTLVKMQPSTRSANATSEYVRVSGEVWKDNTASFDPLVSATYEGFPRNAADGTEYCVELQDDDNKTLDRSCFDLDFAHSESLVAMDKDSFNLLLPRHEDAARVVLKRGSATLAEVNASPSPPTVNITQTSGGLGYGTYTIAWNASDADGDDLRFYVEYAADGESYAPLGAPTTANQITVDSSRIGGGPSAKIRVIATDGFHTTIATSHPFSVVTKPPNVYINGVEPGSGKIYVQPGTSLVLNGSAYDKEDGPLEGSALTWHSSRESGSIGTGETLVTTLASGEHTITLRAEDSHDYVGSQSVEVFVGSQIFMPTMAGVNRGPTPRPTMVPTVLPTPTATPQPTATPSMSPHLDVPLIIDSSSGMLFNDPRSMRKEAAKIFINLMADRDQASLVDFDSEATVLWALSPLGSDRTQILAAVDAIDSRGDTDLSVGLLEGYEQLENSEVPSNRKLAVLMSDGIGVYPSSAVDQYASEGWSIYTVGVGSEIDEVNLESIASATGGDYYFMDEPEDIVQVFFDILSLSTD